MTLLPDLSIEIDENRCEQVIGEYLIPRFGANSVARLESSDSQTISLIITPTPIDEIIPAKTSPEGDLVTQYSKETVEKLGLNIINLIKSEI